MMDASHPTETSVYINQTTGLHIQEALRTSTEWTITLVTPMSRWGDNIKMDRKLVMRFSWSCGWGLFLTGIVTPCHQLTSSLDVRLTGGFWNVKALGSFETSGTTHSLSGHRGHAQYRCSATHHSGHLIFPVHIPVLSHLPTPHTVQWGPRPPWYERTAPDAKDAAPRSLELGDELQKDAVWNVEYVAERQEKSKS